MVKTIDTLVEDIYGIFGDPNHVLDEKNLEELGERIKNAVRRKLKESREKRVPELRMSIIGKPDRQLYFELKSKDTDKVVATEDVDVFEPKPEIGRAHV